MCHLTEVLLFCPAGCCLETISGSALRWLGVLCCAIMKMLPDIRCLDEPAVSAVGPPAYPLGAAQPRQIVDEPPRRRSRRPRDGAPARRSRADHLLRPRRDRLCGPVRRADEEGAPEHAAELSSHSEPSDMRILAGVILLSLVSITRSAPCNTRTPALVQCASASRRLAGGDHPRLVAGAYPVRSALYEDVLQ